MNAATTLWATLGISATNDRALIRRAYASRLKIVHPEDDPEGFKQLRAAYEQAMSLAEHALALAAQAAARAAGRESAPPREPTPEPDPAPAASGQAQGGTAAERLARPFAAQQPLVGRPAHHAAHEAACNRLAGLLSASADPTPADLTAALDAVLASPTLDEVSVQLRTETWLARLICQAAPRSDAILERAAAAFGWKRDALYVADPAVAGAIGRLSGLENSRLLARLDAQLHGPDEPEENKLLGVLDAVTAPRVIRDPQQGPQIEIALAKLLLQTRPRSDALLPTAARRLGWNAPARQASADPAILEAARLADQIAPPRRAVARRRTGTDRAIAGLRAVWLVILALGMLSYCAGQIAKLASYGDAQGPGAASEAQPVSTGPQVVFSKGPSAQGARTRAEIVVSSTTSGSAELQCVAGDGRLGDCSVTAATDADKAVLARDAASSAAWPPDSALAPAPGEPVAVHVSFHGV